MNKTTPPPSRQPGSVALVLKFVANLSGVLLGLGLSMALAAGIALALAYDNLPDISELSNYHAKQPLRVYSADGDLIGEFGEERRSMVPVQDIPKVMRDAVVAIEDARFYKHGGVDYIGILRAAVANLRRVKSQGASTITMQVARNAYLSPEKSYTRKLYEILLTFKLEQQLSKDQILEIYMNQIYLGNRSYGFAAAAETYFGKPLQDINLAEAAMLAGLPQAPSANNPISNLPRARIRQHHILDRMVAHNFITRAEADEAKQEPLNIRPPVRPTAIPAEYVAEMARQLIYAQYGDETYSRGLNVHTTIQSREQSAAYAALREGIMDYERRQTYRGPEKFIELPQDAQAIMDVVDNTLDNHPDNGDLLAAVVLEASPKKVIALPRSGHLVEITGAGLSAAQSGLSAKARPAVRIRPGAVIRIMQKGKDWLIAQQPEVEGALVALDPRSGAITALVGGFDFSKNKFNHATQAWRQPGSTFKPFIYSAGIETGMSPGTIINDTPLFFDSSVTGGKPWEPKNYGGDFEGPMTMRRALMRSKNMVSIRILQAVTPRAGQDWITRFGFDAEKHPPYLPMALGSGTVTPLQMAAGMAVFANGGHYVQPYLITHITDSSGRVLVETTPPKLNEENRVISARNAFVIGTMLQDVARGGTAARAQASLKRSDLYGKTGTTNDAVDAWFVGYQPTLVASVWMGYDQPHNLGSRETGGGLSLPIWINFMRTALSGVPVAQVKPPPGLSRASGDWVYAEYANGGGITNLEGAGLEEDSFLDEPQEQRPATPAPAPRPPTSERNRILDMFSN